MTTQHTVNRRFAACGCIVSHDKDNVERLELCVLHEAAPEMYEALKETYNAVLDFGTRHPEYGGWAGIATSLNQVIAKAEGKN